MYRKRNTEAFIDGENISSRKSSSIMKAIKNQGVLHEAKVYGRQKDPYTRRWSSTAKECGIADVRLYGGPEKDKVDNKIKKDVKNIVNSHKNVDVVCIATNDGGYVDVVKQLRSMGKRVVIIGEKQAPERLRKSCNSFVEI